MHAQGLRLRAAPTGRRPAAAQREAKHYQVSLSLLVVYTLLSILTTL